jgi:uncharacterized protein involved in outer membrane biogenesis
MKTFISAAGRPEETRPGETPARARTIHPWRPYLIPVGVLALLFAYSIAGFLGAAYLLRTNLQSFVASRYHRNLQVRELQFNPFTFVIEADGVSLPDADGQPMVSFERLRVVPSLATLWRFAPSFHQILLEQPAVHAVVRGDGQLNLLDLTKGSATEPSAASKPPEQSMRLFIDQLQVVEGSGELVDHTRSGPFRQELRSLSFELRDFSTRAGTDNLYELTASSPQGMQLQWRGSLQMQPLASRGSFELTGLPVQTIWAYAGSPLAIAAPPGAIAIQGQYDAVSTQEAFGVKVDVPELAVSGLKLRPEKADADYIDLPRLELQNTHLDLAAQSLEVGKVISAGGTVSAWRAADGRVNLLDLMQRSAMAGGASKPAASTPPPASPTSGGSSSAPAWHLSVRDVEVQHLKISVQDRQVTPTASFTLEPLDVHVAGFSSAPDARLDVTVDSTVNGTGQLTATAQMSSGSDAAAIKLDARGLDLVALQPYIAQQTGMVLLKGQLTSEVNLERKADGALSATGTVRVADLRTVDDASQQDFVRWKDLRIEDIRYASGAEGLRIGRIVARQPYARVIVFPNLTTNVQEILTPKKGQSRAGGTSAPSNGQVQTVSLTQPPPARKERKSKDRKVTVAAATPAPVTPFPVSIGDVQIIDASANYTDNWIQPHVAMGIQTLNGSISGLSSAPSSRAKVQLEGKVDRYAPVHIGGQVNLLSAATYSDIKLSFKGLEMTAVTPYSGRFAGYKINKGKLSVDLGYKIENRQLAAEQRFVIDQLQLGDRVESKDAMKLPLRLAVALLKDRNGVIDIGLPMKGSLDDPQFSVGPLVWKAFVNLLEKMVTAPFAALGHLFGGGEQMNIIEFAPGSAELDASAQDRLKGVIKSLTERPQLELDVPAAFSSDLDRRSLAAARLNQQLAQASGRNRKAVVPLDESVLSDPVQHLRLLLAAYRSEMKGAEVPASVKAANEAKTKDAATLAPAIRDLEAPLIERIQVADTDLQQLGTERAQAIQSELVAGGVDGSRVFVVNQGKPAEQNGGDKDKDNTNNPDKVRVEMSLK